MAAGMDDLQVHIIRIWMILIDLPGIHQVNWSPPDCIICRKSPLGLHQLFQAYSKFAAKVVFPNKLIIIVKMTPGQSAEGWHRCDDNDRNVPVEQSAGLQFKISSARRASHPVYMAGSACQKYDEEQRSQKLMDSHKATGVSGNPVLTSSCLVGLFTQIIAQTFLQFCR